MSAFAQHSFNAAQYLSFRPTYPSSFYHLVYSYHRHRQGSFQKAIDLGCGPGFVAQNLASAFTEVVGIDPSQKMVDVALQPEGDGASKIKYLVGGAEDMKGFAEDHSVDLAIAGQAAHWFNFEKVWPELTRILKPKGTAVFFGYGEFHLPAHPSQTPLIYQYHQAPEFLGPHWQQPGRSIVENLLDAVPFPATTSSSVESLKGWDGLPPHSTRLTPEPSSPLSDSQANEWDPSSFLRIKHLPSSSPFFDASTEGNVALRKTLTWHQLESYLRTSSALHAFHQAHPEDGAKEKDLARRFVEELREGVEGELNEGQDNESVVIEWPAVIFLAGKK